MRMGMWIGAPVRALGMVAVMALAACGGGGSSHDEPALEVTVNVDGVADSAGPLSAGETSTIEVPSGATLVFDSPGETRWDPAATSSTYTVNSFSFTSKSMTVSSNAGGTLVVVFTNKADPSEKATLNVTVAPKEFQRVAPVDGEVQGWSAIPANGGVVPAGSVSHQRTVLMDNGAYAIEYEDSDSAGTYSVVRSLYDAEDRYLGFLDTSSGFECLYDKPEVVRSYPLHVGKSWSGESKRTCGSSTVVRNYSSAVESFERVVVPQGTHDVLRINSQTLFTYSFPGYPDTQSSQTSTCWWAVDLGRNVKCSVVTRDSDGNTQSSTSVLASLTH